MKATRQSARVGHNARVGLPPTVLFVDDWEWDCFFQLAAGLRRTGCRALRVTMTPPSRSAALCFDRTVHLDSPDDLARLPSIVEGERIADVQVVESLIPAIHDVLGLMSEAGWAKDWRRRSTAMDKLEVSERLRAGGLHVPRVVAAPVVSTDHLVEALGLPVVHKVRVGSAGKGVSIIRTRQEVQRILLETGNSDAYFFEQYIEGRQLQYGGVVSHGHAQIDVAYETLTRKGSTGPAREVRCLDDQGLTATGRQVAECLDLSGMMNLDVLRDARGRDWVHDVNPRVWATFAAFRPAKLDFLEAYGQWLRGVPSPRPRPGTHLDARLQVYPAAYDHPHDGVSHRRVQLGFIRGALPYLKWIGPRYFAFEAIRHTRQMRLRERSDR